MGAQEFVDPPPEFAVVAAGMVEIPGPLFGRLKFERRREDI
jgi:hypothetical protein